MPRTSAWLQWLTFGSEFGSPLSIPRILIYPLQPMLPGLGGGASRICSLLKSAKTLPILFESGKKDVVIFCLTFQK